jgi:N6-adenosine-specific RNA methylase IME4
MLDVSQYKGAYAQVAQGVNDMVSGHIAVKKKAMACVKAFAEGDFNAPLEQFPGKKAFINDTIEQVRAMPVPDLADPDGCHLYLWITNRSLPKGFGLLEAWGFRYVTMLTWVKPSIGVGNYFRNNTEHILFGIRGRLPLLVQDVGTWMEAPRGARHSAKPDEFYALIARCSPSPRIDIFGRGDRDGFVVWGSEMAA